MTVKELRDVLQNPENGFEDDYEVIFHNFDYPTANRDIKKVSLIQEGKEFEREGLSVLIR